MFGNFSKTPISDGQTVRHTHDDN